VLDAGPGKFVIMLGGEHSISSAPILAWADRLQQEGRRLSVLQFDAHTDLRPEYEGSPYSHASVMSAAGPGRDRGGRDPRHHVGRDATGAPLGQHPRLPGGRHPRATDWMDDVMSRLGDDVYITFDVDGFDPVAGAGDGHAGAGRAAVVPGAEAAAAGVRGARRCTAWTWWSWRRFPAWPRRTSWWRS
jgi:agmatinase